MGIATKSTSQGITPAGVAGWIAARLAPVLLWPLFQVLFRKMGEMLDLQPDDEILDVAWRSGLFLRKCAPRVRRIAGIDLSEIQVSGARRRLRNRIASGMAEIVLGDSADLPWENNSFTVVTSNCLGCCGDPQRSLREMRRVLHPGGRAALLFGPDSGKPRSDEWQRQGARIWNEAEPRQMKGVADFTEVSVSRNWLGVFVKASK